MRLDHSDYKIILLLSRKLSQWKGFSDISQYHKTLQKKISILQFSITQSSSFTKNRTEKGSKIHKKHLVDPEVGYKHFCPQIADDYLKTAEFIVH